MLKFIFSENFFASSMLFAVPIIFAACAALITNKSGSLNINIEGSMSLSALSAALVSHYTNSFVLGLFAAIVTGVVMSLVLAGASLKLKTDGILTGIALNTLATGASIYILYLILGVKGDSSLAPSTVVPNLYIPFLSDIPFIGKVFFSQNFLVYVAIIGVVALSLFLKKTKLGLRIKAVGYNSAAAKSVGIKVDRVKTYSLMIGGIYAGLGGAFLSQAYLSYFSVGMVAGRGFIGIAAEAMGGGSPMLTLLFALLFGAVDYFAAGAQSVLGIPYELLNTLPYLMTIIALVLYSVKKRARDKKKELQL